MTILSTKDDRSLEEIIRAAINRGVDQYIAECRDRVDGFCIENYSLRGTIKIHKNALGWDLLRVPFNIAWAIVVLLVSLLAFCFDKIRCSSVAHLLRKIPVGFTTDVDRYVSHRLLSGLFRMPFPNEQLGWENAPNEHQHDELQKLILQDPELMKVLNDELEAVRLLMKQGYKDRIYSNLKEYGATQTGIADLAGNILGTVVTKATLGTPAFGTLGAGSAVAMHLAHSTAVAGFWAGSKLGAVYYTFIPVSVSKTLLFATTAVVAVLMSFVSTFIGVITDPIQLKFGFHQRRLRKVIDDLEDSLMGGGGTLNLKEKYAGKIFDLIDLLSQIQKVT